MQNPQDRFQAQALLPTITSTVLVTLFFGLFGLIPAVGNSNKARALGVPTSKYWKAFWVTFGIGVLAWVVIITVAAAGAGSASSYQGLGLHRGWQQPHNPHHHNNPCSIALLDCPPTPFPMPPPIGV